MRKELLPEPVLAAELAAWKRKSVPGLAVTERVGRAILRLEWRQGYPVQLPSTLMPAIGRTVTFGSFSLLRISPVSAFLVSDVESPQALVELFRTADVTTVDIGHGVVVLWLAGALARPLLDRVVPVDLDEMVFAAGSLKRTQIAGHGVTINCLDRSNFDLYIDRSLAWSLWERLSARLTQYRD